MPTPQVLKRRTTIAIGLVALLVSLDTPWVQAQGVNRGLCEHQSARVSVPGNFLLGACFDGTWLYIKNQTSFVMRVLPTGDIGAPERVKANLPTSPQAAFTALYPDPLILPPDYIQRTLVRRGAAGVAVSDSGLNSQFLVIRLIATWVPGIGITDSLATFIDKLANALDKATSCLKTHNIAGDVGCLADLSWDVHQATQETKNDLLIEALPNVFGFLKELIDTNLAADRDRDLIASSVIRLDIRANPDPPPPPPRPDPPPTPPRPPTTTTTTRPGNRGVEFAVDADFGWQETPVLLTAGARYSVAYVEGDWSVDHRNWPRTGPEGNAASVDRQIYQGCKLDSTVAYGALLGKEGDGPWFVIGRKSDSTVFTATRNGLLSLRIHDVDRCLIDNDGSIVVRLTLR